MLLGPFTSGRRRVSSTLTSRLRAPSMTPFAIWGVGSPKLGNTKRPGGQPASPATLPFGGTYSSPAAEAAVLNDEEAGGGWLEVTVGTAARDKVAVVVPERTAAERVATARLLRDRVILVGRGGGEGGGGVSRFVEVVVCFPERQLLPSCTGGSVTLSNLLFSPAAHGCPRKDSISNIPELSSKKKIPRTRGRCLSIPL